MKKIMMLMIMGMVITGAAAQPAFQEKRVIQVIGEAEHEVTPDIVYISISLKEYFRDNNNRRKITIDVLEKQLYDAAMKAGVKPEDFMINNISSYNYDWNKSKKDPGFLAAKQYRIKVSNLNAINGMFDAVDPQGIQYSNVDEYDYSNKKELEKELKIQAMQNAKEKADYLSEAVGDKIGKALSIHEGGHVNYPQPVYRQYARAAESVAMAADMQSLDIDFKKVKFSYNVTVVFELL